MKTLTLTLSGPMQSYGVDPRMRYRSTEAAPTKTAIIGLLACAMGRGRGDDISDLKSLSIVAEAQPAEPAIETDFQTIRDCASYDGGRGKNEITYRDYLVAAEFVVTVSGPDELLDQLAHAVQFPRWQLYLGRRAHVPTRPVFAALT